MRTIREHRIEVRNYRRSQRNQRFTEGLMELFFMLAGIVIITGILVFLLNYWSADTPFTS